MGIYISLRNALRDNVLMNNKSLFWLICGFFLFLSQAQAQEGGVEG